ncbi:efflux RND transporter permease subunit [Aeoliella sp.]|uniref:efflux RND transporter permease subunit n=1 Tax=Aeoliella sp. TaxID=2795800 RepID=UPI003CCB9D56
MSIASVAVNKPTVTSFTTFTLLVAGALSYFNLGQLEDPEFTVKSATIVTSYPGASAAEVELEVTDRIEIAIQELAQLDYVKSISRPGSSIVQIEIKPSYDSKDLPGIWNQVRNKVDDIRDQLPPGAGSPEVVDDFGDVYGFLLAVTRDDAFTDADLESYVDALKKELSLVDGVARVELWGVQPQCIYIDVQDSQLSQLGISMEQIGATLAKQNEVVDSGAMNLPHQRLRIEQTGAFRSPEEIAGLTVQGGVNLAQGREATDELIRIGDLGTVERGYRDPPVNLMRYNGKPAIGIAIANIPGANIVDLGRAIDQRLEELKAELPVGIEPHRVSWQSDLVAESIDAFMISLAEAVIIVLVVLWIAMGFSTAMVVGLCGLVFVILGSFLVMSMWGIDLQRMSLGALIIAMGMMVDNAIVVADGILVRIQQGMDRKKAAIEAATQPSLPLLGATAIAVMAFYPIYASDESAGEYCASLFQVVAVALLLSWLLSVTITPLMCMWMLPQPKTDTSEQRDPYDGAFYQAFGRLLTLAIRFRWLVVGGMTAMLVVAMSFFGSIDRTFFPDSARLQIMVDYWAPQGTRIETVSQDLERIEEHLLDDERVTAVSSFIGQGPPRFYLPVEPEKQYSCYAQLIVNVRDLAALNTLVPELGDWAKQNVPEAQTIVRRYGLGPCKTWTVEARLSGPAVADIDELRGLAQQAIEAFEESPNLEVAQTDWRQFEKKVVVDYDQERARWANVSRANVANATKRAFDGLTVGQYRENDKLLPILVRNTPDESRQLTGALGTLQVHPSFSTETVPLAQPTSEIEVEWDDGIIWRRDRRRTITIQARTPDGVPASLLQADVTPALEAIELPPGYNLEWGGEYEDARDSQQSLIPGIVPAVVIVALVLVGLFDGFRPPLIILCTIPFAMIGVVVGLLSTGQPFGFLALLGAMSLAGMMIKNAIVLLDQINIEKAEGKSDYHAVIDAAMSRLRPVLLAAGTTVLGVIPLLQDVFWVAMAVTIMFGLAFGTILTMVLLPVLYACFFKVEIPADAK